MLWFKGVWTVQIYSIVIPIQIPRIKQHYWFWSNTDINCQTGLFIWPELYVHRDAHTDVTNSPDDGGQFSSNLSKSLYLVTIAISYFINDGVAVL